VSVPSLTLLYTPKTKEEVLAVILQAATAVGLPVTAYQAGSVGREFLEICAAAIANFTETSTEAAAGGLLGYSERDWLTLLAYELYEVTREEATFGTCTERLTNTSSSSYTIAAGDMRFYNNRTGKSYTCTTAGTLTPGDVTPTTLDLTIQSDEAGSDSNAAIGEIDGVLTPLFGVTATNTDILVGNDEETDAALRVRCTESLAKASPNGPVDAYNYFAKTATRTSDGSAIGVTRTNVTQGNGTIFVYVADAGGPIDAADVADVNMAIQLNCVPTGFTAVVENATAVTVNVGATVYLTRTSTLSVAELTTLIEERLEAYFANAQIGGYQAGGGFIFTSAIIGEIYQCSTDIVRVVLTTPGADVELESDEVGVLGSVTITAGAP
jgi:phage-related baseplate assembly protein